MNRRTLPLIALILAAFAALVLPAPARAADDAVFTVDNVQVDVTDKDAVTARQKALPQAQQLAFKQLAEKLMTEDQLKRFKAPDDITVATMVKDFEVTQEQLSKVRYIGTYSFRFKGDAVRGYLGNQNLSYTDVSSKALLVLPFYQWGSRTILWGGDNPWLAAWMKAGPSKGLVPLAVPLGDAQDIADIGDKEAFTYDRASLQNMVARYKAGDAAIVMATTVWEDGAGATAPREVDLQIYRTDHSSPEFVSTLKVPVKSGDDANAVYDRAVNEVRDALQHDWKTRTAANPAEPAGAGSTMKVRVKFAGMAQWVQTQKALQAAPGVSGLKVLSLKPDGADVEFAFQGSEDRLRLALAQADITLSTPQVDFSSGQPLVYDLYLNQYAQGGLQ